MSTDAPAIPLFGDAYMADTMHLTLEEHGAYLRLLMLAWRTPDCSLPDDDKRLARMLGISNGRWAKMRETIMAFWTLEEGRWTQKRLKKERLYVAKKSQKNSQNAKVRWDQVHEKQQNDECERISERICQTDAPPPPPTVVEPSSNEEGNNNLIFAGRIIRLKPDQFDRWQKSYPDLDLAAALQSRDDWLATEADPATRKKWFLSTSNWLANRQRGARQSERTHMPVA